MALLKAKMMMFPQTHQDTNGKVTELFSFARAEMAKHGLTDWKLELICEDKVMGRCVYSEKVISLSLPHIEAPENEEIMKNTVLHEIAHALHDLSGKSGSAHGAEWRKFARQVGAEPRASGVSNYNSSLVDYGNRIGTRIKGSSAHIGDIVKISQEVGYATLITSRRTRAVAIDKGGMPYSILIDSLSYRVKHRFDEAHNVEQYPHLLSLTEQAR